MTPLLDLTSPELVSASERASYDRFSASYQRYWTSYIDPVALRLAWTKADTLAVDLRVLPLIDGTEYNDVLELAGEARVSVPSLVEGFRAVVGIGQKAGVRRELSSLVSSGFKLDFLGDYAVVGIADRARLTDIVHRLHPGLPEAPREGDPERVDEMLEASRVPAYAAVGIRSASGAALALVGARKMAGDASGGMLEWSEAGTFRGTTLTKISLGKNARVENGGHGASDAEGAGASLYYALLPEVLFFSLDPAVLRMLIGDALDGRAPGPASAGATGSSQLVVDLAGKKDGALFTVLGWLLSDEIVQASDPSRANAEALLRGAPEKAADPAAFRELSFAYFGAVPTPPHGGVYTLRSDGVNDPARGSASRPRFPALPVQGSAIDALVNHVERFRSEMAFDTEGKDARGRPMRSLHVRTTIGLRP